MSFELVENPYEPSKAETGQAPRRRSKWFVVAGIGSIVAALVVAGPAFATLSMGMSPPGVGRRYATYDPELFLVGFPVSISAARWIGFTLGPIFLAVGITLLLSLRWPPKMR